MVVDLRGKVSHSLISVPHFRCFFSQQDKTRMVKNRRQDEVQEGQEEEDEEDGGGAGAANHGAPGKRGRRQQQGGLRPQSPGL